MISRIIDYNIANKLVLFLTILIHLFFIFNYPISVEFAFINFAKFYENFDKSILLEFIDIQANTIVFSFLIFLIKNIFYIDNYQYAGKLLSISSYFFLYYGIKNLNMYYYIKNTKLVFFIFFLILINPIIWIYGLKVTSDLLPSCIGFFSVSILINRKKSLIKVLISALILSLSILLKPMFAILYLFGFFIILSDREKINLNNVLTKLFLFTILTFLPIIIYLIIFRQFQININSYSNITIYLQNIKEFKLINYLTSFFYQMGLLGIFTAPIIIYYLKKFIKNFFFIFLFIFFFFLGYTITYFPGELDLGTFFLLNTDLLKGAYFAFALLFIYSNYCLFFEIEKKNKYFYSIFLFTVLIYILILSFFRPAQRYLILLIPFYYYFFFIYNNSFKYKLIYFSIAIFIVISFMLTIYSYNKSLLAKEVIDYLKTNNIISQTVPGPISDSYNFKKYQNYQKKYILTKKKSQKFIAYFNSEKYWIKINYYLVEI